MSGLSANAKVNLLANRFGALHSNLYCFPWPRPKFGGYFSFAENFSRHMYKSKGKTFYYHFLCSSFLLKMLMSNRLLVKLLFLKSNSSNSV